MSRMPIRTFLVQAKRALQQVQHTNNGPASFVIGNESADLDSITCALVYGYLKSSERDSRRAKKFWIPVTNIPEADLHLRPELTALLKHAQLSPSDLITLDDIGKVGDFLPPEKTDWTLVDHNVFQGSLGDRYGNRVVGVIDHHDDEGKVPQDANPRLIGKTGSCNSHVVNLLRESWDAISSSSTSVGAANGQDEGGIDDAAFTSTWDAQVAKLALGSILIDTINFKAEHKVTDHDRKAVKYLEARINASPKLGRSYDRDEFFKEINDAKSDLDSLSLRDILRKDYKEWSEGDLSLGISSCVQSLEYLQTKSQHFIQDLVDFVQERKLQLFAIMTAHNSSKGFQRQLLLLCPEEGEATKSAKSFTDESTKELQLEESDIELVSTETELPFLKAWEQKNLEASRKQVGPMLRKAMKTVQKTS